MKSWKSFASEAHVVVRNLQDPNHKAYYRTWSGSGPLLGEADAQLAAAEVFVCEQKMQT